MWHRLETYLWNNKRTRNFEMKKSVDILIKSGFLAGNSTDSIKLTSLGQQLKTVVAVLVTKINSKITDSNITTPVKCSKTKYLETFFKIQRERKIWWMKYSSNPGRFRFSDFIQTEENTRKVNICSDFGFGAIDFETLEVHPLDERDVLIQSTIALDQVVLGILIDASEERLLRLHRHLAPYQVSLLHSSGDKEMALLRDHIFHVLTKTGIRMDPDKNAFKAGGLDELILVKDRIGIPFDIIVDGEALNCGLMKLRNRDTNISEIVHISSLSGYLIKMLNC